MIQVSKLEKPFTLSQLLVPYCSFALVWNSFEVNITTKDRRYLVVKVNCSDVDYHFTVVKVNTLSGLSPEEKK